MLATFLAVASIVLLGANTPSGYAKASSASYAALNSSAAPDITLLPEALPVGHLPTGPSFVTSQPAGAALSGEPDPLGASIRPITVGVAGVSAWIAKSSVEGVCVLVSAVGAPYYPLDTACTSTGETERGTTVEVRGVAKFGGKNLLVGVVPDGTNSVEYKMAEGSAARAQVQGNGWAALISGTYSSQIAIGG
ncbi:MAG: hypothetical protein H0X28_15465 [Solirubrobacterales bacterium]|nr:hypothetical protein [Solirubrobacterales bacterium]